MPVAPEPLGDEHAVDRRTRVFSCGLEQRLAERATSSHGTSLVEESESHEHAQAQAREPHDSRLLD